MTTVATPARQPFGILNDSKLRSLQSLKNRQNAITPHSAPTSLKRRAPSPAAEAGSDTENIDPSFLDSLHKRKRSAFDDDVSKSKTQRYSLNVTTPSISTRPRPSATISTPRLETFVKPSITPASAPPAGRSPTRKRSSGLLQPRKRFNPPAFSSTQAPSLSLSAALNGTKKSRPLKRKTRTETLETSKPKSWSFDIYEESEEIQDYRMNEWTMTQSATGLDISDDESKGVSKKSPSGDRGKENIDPNDMVSAPVTRAMAAAAAQVQEKEVKMDDKNESRIPLGDLNPAEFYAEGLDATSVVLVHDDEEAETDVEGDDPKQSDFTFQPSTTSIHHTSKPIEDMDAPSLAAILSSGTPNRFETCIEPPVYPAAKADVESRADADGDLNIDIWESESAIDENENENETAALPESPRSISGDGNAYVLQQL